MSAVKINTGSKPKVVIAHRRHGFVTVAGSGRPYLLTSEVVLVDEGGADRWYLGVGYIAGSYQSVTPCASREAALEALTAMTAPPVESRGALLDEVELMPEHLPRLPHVVARYDSARGWRGGTAQSACDRCKSGIRRVVVIEDCHGRIIHVGADCAQSVLSGRP